MERIHLEAFKGKRGVMFRQMTVAFYKKEQTECPRKEEE